MSSTTKVTRTNTVTCDLCGAESDTEGSSGLSVPLPDGWRSYAIPGVKPKQQGDKYGRVNTRELADVKADVCALCIKTQTLAVLTDAITRLAEAAGK